MKKGISLIALISTVAITLILITTITITGINTSNNAEKMAFASEISSISQAVNTHVINEEGDYPIKNAILLDVTDVTNEAMKQFTDNNEVIQDNKILLYEIDYNMIMHNNLKYGKGNDGSNDIYAVSITTGKVYYAKGLKIGGNSYYTLTSELSGLLGYNSNKDIEFANNAVIFVPSNMKWTNKDIKVTVKVPKNYIVNSVKLGETNISLDDQLTEADTEYNIYSTDLSSNGQIVVLYKEKEADEKTKVAKYNVNNVDKTPPNISIDVENQVLLTGKDEDMVGYVKILLSSDDLSGVKKIKYSEDIVNTDIANHFDVLGKEVKNEFITIRKGVRNITVYIEDNAGNYRTQIINIKIVVPATTEEYASKNRTIDGKAPSYKNPIIPKGFRAVNIGVDANKKSIEPIYLTVGTKTPGEPSTGYAASWKNVSTDYDRGLVIEDSTGNQFVWVPAAKYGYSAHYGGSGATDTIGTGINEQTQIDTYGGFWIGRFEASDNAGNVASMQNKTSWLNVSYNDSKTKSEAFATTYGHSKTYFESSLLTGKMWDTTLKFIASDETNVDTDSISWGNYVNANITANDGSILKALGAAQLLNTGVTNYTNKKNIYDVAGNVWEWMNDIISSDRAHRGASYGSNGTITPASSSGNGAPTFVNITLGFRFALYIK